jgi:hypothetical protein
MLCNSSTPNTIKTRKYQKACMWRKLFRKKQDFIPSTLLPPHSAFFMKVAASSSLSETKVACMIDILIGKHSHSHPGLVWTRLLYPLESSIGGVEPIDTSLVIFFAGLLNLHYELMICQQASMNGSNLGRSGGTVKSALRHRLVGWCFGHKL